MYQNQFFSVLSRKRRYNKGVNYQFNEKMIEITVFTSAVLQMQFENGVCTKRKGLK